MGYQTVPRGCCSGGCRRKGLPKDWYVDLRSPEWLATPLEDADAVWKVAFFSGPVISPIWRCRWLVFGEDQAFGVEVVKQYENDQQLTVLLSLVIQRQPGRVVYDLPSPLLAPIDCDEEHELFVSVVMGMPPGWVAPPSFLIRPWTAADEP